MAKKKENKRDQLIKAYMHHVLEHGEQPKSVYSFAQDVSLKESDFYEYFGSFEALEQIIFQAFFENAISVLHKNQEYQTFDAQNKLLSFFYTFFEVLKANRSYVLFVFLKNKSQIQNFKATRLLKKSFDQFIDDLELETMDLKEKRLEEWKEKGVRGWAWGQLLFTMKFWIDDTSAGFEKTDLFIEKSLTTSFKLMDNSTLNSVVDLGKFLIKEKVW